MQYFHNKRVWVTGASSGIGEALALALAEKGANLILSARNEQALNRVAAACSTAGAGSVIVQPLDLAKAESLALVADRVFSQVGKIDILINNGGISQRALAMETNLEVDRQMMNVNYFGTIALSKAVLANMQMHQLGHIVTITSLMGKFGSPYRSSYAGAKHALHGFFDSLRAELDMAGMPVKITLICPGFIRTNISLNAMTGTGESLGTMDDATNKGMEPQRLASKILRAIESGKREAYFGGTEVLGIYLKRFFPGILAGMIAKAKVR